jgi:hypothetical protein
MGMSIEEAHGILSNGLANAPSEHEWCVAFKMAIETMRKYQKIQEIVSDFREYQKGISCGFGGATYMQMVSEVIEDGRT